MKARVRTQMGYVILERSAVMHQKDTVFQPDRSYQVMGRGVLRNNIKIREAILPEVQIVEEQAFYNCTALRTVEFGKLAIVKKEAFGRCSNLRKIVLPATVQRLDTGAFSECRRLKEVLDEQSSYDKLSEQIFSRCTQLTHVQLSRKLRVIEGQAFYKCEALKQIQFPNTLCLIGERAFCQSGITCLELPGELLTISDEAFLKCRGIEYVRIPESVKKIGRWAFHGCSRMKVLEIHHDPEEIGEWITNKNCIIRCPKGSRMEKYAMEYGMEVEHLQ